MRSIATLIARHNAIDARSATAIAYAFSGPDDVTLAAVPSGIEIVKKRSGIWSDPSAKIDWVSSVPSMKMSPCAKLISSMIP